MVLQYFQVHVLFLNNIHVLVSRKNIRHNTSMAICSALIGAMCCCLGDIYAKGSDLHPVEENAYRDVC